MSSGDLDLQRSIWNRWNLESRVDEVDEFMRRQLSEALEFVEALGRQALAGQSC